VPYREAEKMSKNNKIGPGSDIIVPSRDDGARMMTRTAAIECAQAFLRDRAPEGRLVSEELIAERRAEAGRE